ncbi:alpha/beta fold hydrolase [Ferruginibacter sp.]|nr:alpha/beta hydrolase [Ferruginibacter sp.]
MKKKQFSYQDSNIFYRVTGTGKPVVLLHGFGEDGDIWANQVEFLSAGSGEKDHYQLIIPDLPGSGKSELITDMSIEGMAECIKALIDFEFLSSSPTLRFSLIGHSMGGYIALAFAEKHSALLNSFGLVHSSAYADGEEKKEARRKSIEFIKTNGAYEFLKTAIPGLFYQPENNKACEDLVKASKNFTAEALIAYYTAMINRPDRTAILKTFTQPILFVMGQYDKAVPFDQSMQQSHLPNQAHIHILRNSAHMGMWEEAEKTNEALLKFLENIS